MKIIPSFLTPYFTKLLVGSLFLLACFAMLPTATASTPQDSLLTFVRNTKEELKSLQQIAERQQYEVRLAITQLETQLRQKEQLGQFDAQYLQLLAMKFQFKDNLEILETQSMFQITKVRYRKGLELIKMMYEKVLALDHHFSALQTYQSIASLTNPNSYPEFQAARALIEKKSQKKISPIKLPALLESNPYVSIASTLVNFLVIDGDSEEKEKDLNKIACIMDFTMRMNSDLSIINHETGFLRQYNTTLKEECVVLFEEYTKVLGYTTPLDRCRKSDDWDKIIELLDTYVEEMDMTIKKTPNDKGVYKKQVNLDFAVDRLLDYINKYTLFVSQGEKYYQKFKGIVNSYENEAKCANQLPKPFSDLKKDIDNSIEKFNTSYNLAELKGSKMKDLLYGRSEGE